MKPRKLTLQATESHRGQRLDQVLAQWLPEVLSRSLSKAKVRKLLIAGAIYLNGKRVRIASKIILPGARIDAYVDIDRLLADASSNDRPFAMTENEVLFEDEFLIAVNKPAGLPTQPTLDEARDNLFAAVKRFMAERVKVSGGGLPYVGLHHRLDRDTSGVVLFTCDSKANAGVAELFSGHLAAKTYWALCARPRGAAIRRLWEVKNYLGRLKSTGGKKALYGEVRSGGDFAHTDFRVLEELGDVLWVEARPRTGRTHQIRVHLAEAGMPILGDLTYGGSDRRVPRLMLHAASLEFVHPLTGASLKVESPMPEDFRQGVDRLRNGSRS